MGPKAGLDRCGKSRLPLGFDPRAVQPVASRYTDCVIPAHEELTGTREYLPLQARCGTQLCRYKRVRLHV